MDKATLAAEVPGQDLSLWINLGKYESVDPEISIAARKALETTSDTFQMKLYRSGTVLRPTSSNR